MENNKLGNKLKTILYFDSELLIWKAEYRTENFHKVGFTGYGFSKTAAVNDLIWQNKNEKTRSKNFNRG